MQTWRASLTNCAEIINHSGENIKQLKQPEVHLVNNNITSIFSNSLCLQGLSYIAFSQYYFSASQEKQL
jgi:hypothetical protein